MAGLPKKKAGILLNTETKVSRSGWPLLVTGKGYLLVLCQNSSYVDLFLFLTSPYYFSKILHFLRHHVAICMVVLEQTGKPRGKLLMYFYVYMCVPAPCSCRGMWGPGGIRSPGDGVIGGCEPPNNGARTVTLSL